MASQQNDVTSKECKVCFNVFNSTDRRPRSLPCGHTFCSKCISDNLKKNKIFCPSCRRKHQATTFTDIPVNYVLECMIQEISCGQPSPTEVLTSPGDESRGISKKLREMRLELRSGMEGISVSSQEASANLHQYKSQLMELREDHQKTMEKFLAIANQHKKMIKHIDKASLRVEEAIQEGEDDRRKMKMAENNLAAASTAHDIIPTLEEADHCYDALDNWTQRVQEQFPDTELLAQAVTLRERAESALQVQSFTDEEEEEASALTSSSLLNMQETLTGALDNAAVCKRADLPTPKVTSLLTEQSFSNMTLLPGQMFESGRGMQCAKITPNINRSHLNVVNGQKLTLTYSSLPEVLRTVTENLDNLTTENFTESYKSFQMIQTASVECLSNVADLFYEKAVDVSESSPSSVKLYAQMCRCLSHMGTGSKFGVKFKNLIINKCQKEYENYQLEVLEELAVADMLHMHAGVNLYKLSLEERRIPQRSLGNIRFIGELYNQGMLASPTMIRVIGKLLQKRDEKSLECLCELLKVIGKMLQTRCSQEPKHLEQIEKHFRTLEKIVSENLVDARIFRLIKQVIYLRKMNWSTYSYLLL